MRRSTLPARTWRDASGWGASVPGMKLRSLTAWVAGLPLGVSSAVFACPDCPTSRVVRRAVAEVGVGEALVMVGTPFVLVGFLSALLYRVGLPRHG